MGSPSVPGWASQLANFKQSIVTGAAANANIAVAGLKATDKLVSVVNLTDLTNVALAGAVKASLACAGKSGNGKYDATLEATTAGLAGNAIKVRLVGDSPTGGGVTIDVAYGKVTIHYEAGVSTVANVNTAITALAGGNDIVDVKTAGTGATVLDAGAAFADHYFLSGGLDAGDDVPAITSAGNIQFPNTSTAAKKLLVTYIAS